MTHMMHALICEGEGCTQPGHPPRIRHDATSGHVTVEMHGETFVILDLGDIATATLYDAGTDSCVIALGPIRVTYSRRAVERVLKWLAAAERQLERAKP